MKKWEYRILARIHGRNYLIWQYSHHFHDNKPLTRRQKRVLEKKGYSSIASFEGTQHSNTAVGWVLGLYRDIEKWNAADNFGHKITNEFGMFNPHFRLSNDKYPDVWFNRSEVSKIYFEMSLVDVPDKEPADAAAPIK